MQRFKSGMHLQSVIDEYVMERYLRILLVASAMMALFAGCASSASARERNENGNLIKGFQYGISLKYDLTITGTSAGAFASVGYRFNEKNYLGIHVGPSLIHKRVAVEEEPATRTSIPENSIFINKIGCPVILEYRRYARVGRNSYFICGMELGYLEQDMMPLCGFKLGADFKLSKAIRMNIAAVIGGSVGLSCGITF